MRAPRFVPIAIALTATLAVAPAAAQKGPAAAYPAKALTIINPFPPGGSLDMMARVVAQKLNESWNQPVVVENRPGASGTIGLSAVARAPADGHTLGLIIISHTANVTLQGVKQPYDLLRDFAPVTHIMSQPYIVVVNASLPVRSIAELIALAKAKPNEITYGSSGVGSMLHLAAALFASQGKVKIAHIPYKGVAPAITAVAGGEIAMLFSARASALSLLSSGRLRAIAVTSKQRMPAAPEIPTMQESGMPGGYDLAGWYGIGGPAGMPAAAIDKLQREIARILALPDIREKMIAEGMEPVGSTPAQFAALIRTDIDKWRNIIEQAGIAVGSH